MALVACKEEPTCIWYGVCYTDEDTEKGYNCPKVTKGEILQNGTAIEILQRRCPHIDCKLDPTV